jgi:hypothetical protein
MTPEIAAMMRVNLTNRADQMDALAGRAKSDDDAELFRRGAEKYRRLLTTLPDEPKEPADHVLPLCRVSSVGRASDS